MRIPFNADEVYVHFISECSANYQRIRLPVNQSEAYQNRSLFEQNARQTVLNPTPGSTCFLAQTCIATVLNRFMWFTEKKLLLR